MRIDFAFKDLNLNTIYGDAVLRNKRSQHVLEKLGFVETHVDKILRYYELRR